MKRTIVAGTITALLLGLAGTSSALVWMHGKVRALPDFATSSIMFSAERGRNPQ